jgi:Protein of unknown function (DUF2934)
MAKPRVPQKTSDAATTNPAVEPTSNKTLASETNGSGAAPNGGATKTVRKKIAGQPGIGRSELRATVVPINLEEEIRRLAYLMAERRGFEPGHEADDWFAAEREVRQRYHQHSA